MSDNVVSIYEKLDAGELTFVCCNCDGSAHGEPMTPVVLHDNQGPIITAVLCPNCEDEIPVVNGVLQMDRE